VVDMFGCLEAVWLRKWGSRCGTLPLGMQEAFRRVDYYRVVNKKRNIEILVILDLPYMGPITTFEPMTYILSNSFLNACYYLHIDRPGQLFRPR